jgi:hypothetical protein
LNHASLTSPIDDGICAPTNTPSAHSTHWAKGIKMGLLANAYFFNLIEGEVHFGSFTPLDVVATISTL